LEFPWPSLPKGWVYAVEDVSVKTKVKVVDPNSYLTLNAPRTHHQRKHLEDDQSANPYHRYRRASNITEALLSSLSASKRTATKHPRVTSTPTLTLQIPL
jgi:hypothetical protein